MARIYWDGAETGDLRFWTSTSGAVSASLAQAKTGQYSYFVNGGTLLSRALSAPLSEFYAKLYLYQVSGNSQFLRYYNGATLAGYLDVLAASGAIRYYVGGTLTATSAIAIPANAWTRVELYLKIANVGGIAQVRIDGVEAINYTGDTLPGTSATIDSIRAETGTYYLDDIALNSTAGGSDNSWIGDERYTLLVVDGAGDSADWMPSAGANWQCVDDIPPDGDTSYVETATPGAIDLYSLTDFDSTDRQILRVQSVYTARGTVGGETIDTLVKSGGTTYTGASVTLTTNYAQYKGTDYTTDPATSAAWDDAGVDGLQVGQEAT